jgi:hypothetical protein
MFLEISPKASQALGSWQVIKFAIDRPLMIQLSKGFGPLLQVPVRGALKLWM